jgi:hypothetical protein
MEDLGSAENPDLVVSNLTMQWPGLIRNLNTLHEMVAAAKRGNKEVADTLNEEVQTISGQLLLLLSKLGDRPEEFNGALAFEALTFVKEELTSMNGEVTALEMMSKKLVDHNERHTENLELLRDLLKNIPGADGVTESDLTGMRDAILVQVRAAIQPFIQLVQRTSSTKTDPGGLLMNRLLELERGVVELRTTKADVVDTLARWQAVYRTRRPDQACRGHWNHRQG